jgi:hypothetical protein
MNILSGVSPLHKVGARFNTFPWHSYTDTLLPCRTMEISEISLPNLTRISLITWRLIAEPYILLWSLVWMDILNKNSLISWCLISVPIRWQKISKCKTGFALRQLMSESTGWWTWRWSRRDKKRWSIQPPCLFELSRGFGFGENN